MRTMIMWYSEHDASRNSVRPRVYRAAVGVRPFERDGIFWGISYRIAILFTLCSHLATYSLSWKLSYSRANAGR